MDEPMSQGPQGLADQPARQQWHAANQDRLSTEGWSNAPALS